MEYYKLVEDRAKMLIPNYQRTEVYDILTEYFAKSDKFKERGFDLNKGLLVTGDVGTGKTAAFDVFREILRASNRFFQVASCRQIIRDYTTDGAKVLNKYGRDSKNTVYFDDLGLEEVNVKMYGNNANVMSEIMLDRYENYKRYGVITYATSNLGAKEFGDIYGDRMRDRMREMFNFIPVTGDSFRK